MSECAVIPPLRLKSFCVRTHRAKTAHLPAEYIPPTFLTRTPSPFCAGSSWGLLSRKIFLFFQSRLARFKFLDISHELRFWFIQYKLSFRLVTSYHSTFTICFVLYSSRLDFSISDIKLRLVFTRYISLVFVSTCFSIVYSTLYLLNSLSL